MAVHRIGQKTFGPWGNHTSSIDWCEDNYTHHPLVAEFWNTFSNIPFIALGIFGILSTRALPVRIRSRAALTHAFVAIIGMGSFVFHATLLWHAQVILDELPMLWSAAMGLYLTRVGGADHGSTGLKMLMIAVPTGLSWLYLSYPNPVLHQVAYGVMQAIIITQVVRMFKRLPRETAEQVRMREECRSQFYKGAGFCLLGFAIWNVDNIFCDHLTGIRSGKGELVGLITQGHAWWHLLTGIGGSRIITAMTYLSTAARQPNDFEFASFLGHPYVRPQTRTIPQRSEKSRKDI
ncbi:hypothetical protein FRB94_013725 [Tulasnella sp. JGI-2019a]|nr:hypothetical protein FRB94_013725 [Tulasnella sp. JGI-2019a]KAG9009168.1 hypothetical protein FRB93_005664 [Tulasnella sp. JGI-2019a]